MLRHRINVRAGGLAVPARHPGKPVGDVLDLDIERGGVEQIEPSTRQHALPGARRRAGVSFLQWGFGRQGGVAFCSLPPLPGEGWGAKRGRNEPTPLSTIRKLAYAALRPTTARWRGRRLGGKLPISAVPSRVSSSWRASAPLRDDGRKQYGR